MDLEHSITQLIGLAKDGQSEALAELWKVYFRQLVAVARRKLQAVPRRVADEEDLALSAFKSFWNGLRHDRFPELQDRTSLWPLLVAITLNKCVDHVRRQTRQKRSRAEECLVPLDQIVSREPNPEVAQELTDQLEWLLNVLDQTGDTSLRRVAELRLHGHTTTEIAESLKCAKRTVERKLSLIEQCWANEVFDESER